MPITVSDCLQAPSLKNAVLLGGRAGLSRPVRFVTVLEAAKTTDIRPEFVRKQQIMISSFASIRDDIDEQLRLLELLNEAATSAVVLFQYSGMFLQRVDERLITQADRLGLPLICISPQQYDIIYTDVIHDIVGLIFHSELDNHFVLPDVFADFSGGDADLDTVLQVLAERFGGMLLLLDGDQNILSFSNTQAGLAAHLLQEHQDVYELVERIKKNIHERMLFLYYQRNVFPIYLSNTSLRLYSNPILDGQGNRLCLWYICDQQENMQLIVEQMTRITSTAVAALTANTLINYQNMLVAAIMGKHQERQQRLGEQLRLDPQQLGMVWITEPGLAAGRSRLADPAAFHSVEPPLLSGIYRGRHAYFFPQVTEEDNLEELYSQLLSVFGGESDRHFVHPAIHSPDAAADFFHLAHLNSHTAQVIYPHLEVVTYAQLFFVDSIQKIQSSAGEDYAFWLDILKPLQHEADLISLLEVMLLDANMNAAQSAELLYIHKNTVYYRLKKIRALLGFDPFSPPGMHSLAIALALRRVLAQ